MNVVPKLAGRLGNILFMVAYAYTIAQEKNIPLKLYKPFFNKKGLYLSTILRQIETVDLVYDSDVQTSGYFQSYTYFKKYNTEIRNLYTEDDYYSYHVKPLFNFLNLDTTCAISIRRGDYLSISHRHPVVSKDYILQCMSDSNADNFLVFSDDLPWCKDNFKQNNIFFYDTNLDDPVRKLWLMSECGSHIISNSSYSWWGAFLNKTQNNKVWCPKTWYGPSVGNRNWDQIYLPHWNVVNTKYENGYIIPI